MTMTHAEPCAASDAVTGTAAMDGQRRARAASSPLQLAAGYFPAVDGLRAVAILSVLTYHTGLYHNGLFGVDVFFVLSGFLITWTLLREHHKTGAVHLGRFYLRRARRLLPALLVVLALTAWAVIRLGSTAEVTRFRDQALASLAYVTNWEQIAAGQDYWAGFDQINPLGHMWSLAITEQYYLVWPTIVLAVLLVGRRTARAEGRRPYAWQWSVGRPMAVAVVGAVGYVVASLQPLLRFDGTNADRLYLGTDTHVMGLLAGSTTAALVHVWNVRRSARLAADAASSTVTPLRTAMVTAASAGLLAAIVVLALQAHDYGEAWLYRWGFAAVAVLTSALVVTLTSPANLLSRVLAAPPLVEIGKISYTLFLVHLPLYWLIMAVQPSYLPGDLLLVGVLGSLLVAGALHHLVAEPIRLRRWRARGTAIFTAGLAAVTAVVFATPAIATTLGSGHGDLRVLTLGDSLANDFADALATNAASEVTVIDGGLPGCGVLGATRSTTAAGITQEAPEGCDPWQERWGQLIDGAAADVIVVNVAWDAITSEVDGQWTDLRDPATAERYRRQLDRVAELTAGTPVLVADARAHNAVITPEQAVAYNAVLEEFVASHSHVTLLDLAAQVCTADGCRTETAEGQAMYLDDRVHFSAAGKREIAPWLLGAAKAVTGR